MSSFYSYILLVAIQFSLIGIAFKTPNNHHIEVPCAKMCSLQEEIHRGKSNTEISNTEYNQGIHRCEETCETAIWVKGER